MEQDAENDQAKDHSFDLPINPSVNRVLKKVDKGHLDRVNKEVGEHLTKILNKVNLAIQHSEDIEEDPEVLALYTDEGRLYEIRRRAAVLESISIFVESSVVIQKDLERLLEWLTDWGDVSSDVEPEDVGVNYSDLPQWIAHEEAEINQYLESTRLCIYKLLELCSILTGALPPKEGEPKKPGDIKEGFWKFWREDGLSAHITETLQQGTPWSPDHMLENEEKTAQKVEELLDVLRELASSPTSSKIQGALIFYIIGMIDNLSKALSLQCKQFYDLQSSVKNLEVHDFQVNEKFIELTTKVQVLHDKKRELESQLRQAANEYKAALTDNQHMASELKSLKLGALVKTHVGPPVDLKAISSQLSQKGVQSLLLAKRESLILEGSGVPAVREEGAPVVSTKDTGLEEHLAKVLSPDQTETLPSDAGTEQPSIPPAQVEGETITKLEEFQELPGIPPHSPKATGSKELEEGLQMPPMDTGLPPVKESVADLRIGVPSSPEAGTMAEEESHLKIMDAAGGPQVVLPSVAGEVQPAGLPSSLEATRRPPVTKGDLTVPADVEQLVDLEAVDARRGSQLDVVGGDQMPLPYSLEATGRPSVVESDFEAKDVSEGVQIVLPSALEDSSAPLRGEVDLETLDTVISLQQITDGLTVGRQESKTALDAQMEIQGRLATPLDASRIPQRTLPSLDETVVPRDAEERRDSSISISTLEEFQQAIHNFLEKKVASHEQVWGPDSRTLGVLPRDPQARKLYSITQKKIEDYLLKLEENIRRELGLEVAQTSSKPLTHRGIQASLMVGEDLQRLTLRETKMGESPEGHEQMRYLTEQDYDEQVNEQIQAPSTWQSLLSKCQAQRAKGLISPPTTLEDHQQPPLESGRTHSAKKEYVPSVDRRSAPQVDDEGVSQVDRSKKMSCLKDRVPLKYIAEHTGMLRHPSPAESEIMSSKEPYTSTPSGSKDTIEPAPDIETQMMPESELDTPPVMDETKERYWVDVKSQKMNLDLLSRAQRLSGLPPQVHDVTRNVILDILNTDPARLGSLFRKYTSFYFIQRVRQNVVSRLAKARSAQDGLTTRALYQVLDRVDSYQRRILQRWAARQENIERSRRAYISRAIDVINKLRTDWDLHLSPPFLTVVPIPLKTAKAPPCQRQKKLLPLKALQEQASCSQLPNIQKAKDPGFLEISRRSTFSSMQKVWETKTANQGFEITTKKALSSASLRQGGFPEVPRLLELDVTAIRNRALRAIQRRISESLK